MLRVLVVVALMGVAGVGAGCATVARATEPVTETVGEALISEQDLQRLGAQMSEQVKQQMGVVEDPDVQNYVDAVGRQIVATIPDDQQKFEYQFTVVEAPDMVNAFALPGGHIFVTSGLLQQIDTEAQLAGVLAHEVAHIREGHVESRIAAQYGVQALQQLALGRDPGLLSQIASNVAARGYLAAYSREDEREADETGLMLLSEAGYRPAGLPNFLQQLAAGQEGRAGVFQFFASHPAPEQRVQRLENLIEERNLSGGRVAIIGGFEQIQAQVGASPVG